MRLKQIVVLTVAFLLGTEVLAQTHSDSLKIQRPLLRNFISFVPQYSITDGFRVDYERGIKENQIWLGLGTMFFYSQGEYYGYGTYYNVNSLNGVGILPNIKFRAYNSDKVNKRSGVPRHIMYLETGPLLQYFKVNYETEIPQSFIENGVEYFEFELQEVTSSIFRTGLNLNVGWQLVLNQFVMDVYVGAGFRVSFAEDEPSEYYYAEWISPLYTGFLLNGGIKFGFLF